MPRPEQTPTIRAPDTAEHGTTAELERLDEAVQTPAPEEPTTAGTPAQPPPAQVPLPEETVEFEGVDDVLVPDDEEDDDFDPLSPEEEIVYGESIRGNEPGTAGAPFGDGADFIRAPDEDDRTFMGKVARELVRYGDRDAKRYARRIATEVLGIRRLDEQG